MLFIFLVQAYSQYIMEGINILEKGFNFKIDYNYYFPQKCQNEFQMRCNIKQIPFQKEELQLKKKTLHNAQELLDSLEQDDEYHPYYQRTINAFLHEIVFYEEKESLLNVFLDLRKNTTNDARIINNTFMIDVENRVIVDITNFTEPRNDSRIYVEVDGIQRIQETKSKQEEPSKFQKLFDGFVSKAKEVGNTNGKIEFSKAMYVKELYAKTNGKEAQIEFRLNETVRQINHLKQDQRLQLIRGPLGQLVNNIRFSDHLQIGIVHLKTDKIKLTYQQQLEFIIDRLIAIYRAIHQQYVYDANVKVLLNFIDKILLKIKQQNTAAESSDKILEIIQQIENEMSSNELKQLEDIIELITSSKLTASDISSLQLQLKKVSENDQ